MRTSMVVAMLSLLAMACNDDRAYYHFEHIDNEGWYRNDTITFVIPPQPAGTYHTTLCLRATPTFPYTTLTVNSETCCAAAGKPKTRKFRCHIYNNVGKLNGKRGVSNSELCFPMPDIVLQDSESITIKIHHLMRREPLPGITDIGIELTGAQDYARHQYEGR